MAFLLNSLVSRRALSVFMAAAVSATGSSMAVTWFAKCRAMSSFMGKLSGRRGGDDTALVGQSTVESIHPPHLVSVTLLKCLMVIKDHGIYLELIHNSFPRKTHLLYNTILLYINLIKHDITL